MGRVWWRISRSSCPTAKDGSVGHSRLCRVRCDLHLAGRFLRCQPAHRQNGILCLPGKGGTQEIDSRDQFYCLWPRQRRQPAVRYFSWFSRARDASQDEYDCPHAPGGTRRIDLMLHRCRWNSPIVRSGDCGISRQDMAFTHKKPPRVW